MPVHHSMCQQNLKIRVLSIPNRRATASFSSKLTWLKRSIHNADLKIVCDGSAAVAGANLVLFSQCSHREAIDRDGVQDGIVR